MKHAHWRPARGGRARAAWPTALSRSGSLPLSRSPTLRPGPPPPPVKAGIAARAHPSWLRQSPFRLRNIYRVTDKSRIHKTNFTFLNGLCVAQAGLGADLLG